MIELIVTLAIVGVVIWGVTQIPMPQWLKTVIYVVAAICVVCFLLNAFGLMPNGTHDIPVPKLGNH